MTRLAVDNLTLTDVQRFLCACLVHRDHLNRQLISELYLELGEETAYEEAKQNGVASIVADALILSVVDVELPDHWKDEYSAMAILIEKYMEQMESASSLLFDAGIHMVALKNSGITKALYPFYGACPMGDIDVLVRQEDFRHAHRVLTNAGYRLKFRSSLEEDSLEAALKGGGAEYQVDLPNGGSLWFELQWRPVAGRWIQPHQEPKASDLMARSIPVKDSTVRILSPVDNLLQVCLHTAKHSYVRAPGFRLHTDVDRIVRTQNIDWKEFVELVKKLKTKTAVFFSLALARSLLGTQVPDEVLTTLQPNRWKEHTVLNSLLKVGLFEPNQPKWSKLSYIYFVICLYDSVGDLYRAVIPDASEMKKRYGFDDNWLLPVYHFRRLLDLVLKRENT